MASNVTTVTTLVPSKAPNIPIGPVEYSQQYQDQFTNILRLYFNQIDNDWTATLGSDGGRYFRFPHISAYDSSNQYALSNTVTTVLWGTLTTGSGFTLNANSTATCTYTGVYKIDYSLQFANNDNAQHEAVVWLKNNGDDVTESATVFSLQQRRSSTIPTFVCGYSHVTFEVTAGDVIALVWATDKGATANGSAQGVYIEATISKCPIYKAFHPVNYWHNTVCMGVST